MFQKAQKKKVKLKLGISGPSGSGKTMSALRLAKGLGGKTAVIDTENGSASLYSDKFDFDVCELRPPYTTDKYNKAIMAAVNAGYDNLIIDSISAAWTGDGGVLDRKTQKDSRGGNNWTNWASFTKEQNAFLSQILQAQANLIVTMRSKQSYELVQDGNKTKVQKLGLKPEQRDGVEYELTVMFDVGMTHECEATKDRTGLYVNRIFQVTEETGKELKNWLNSGKDICAELIKEIDSRLKLCADDYVEKVGTYLDDPVNQTEIKLNQVLLKVNNHLEQINEIESNQMEASNECQ